jgi:hypothetical protein
MKCARRFKETGKTSVPQERFTTITVKGKEKNLNVHGCDRENIYKNAHSCILYVLKRVV